MPATPFLMSVLGHLDLAAECYLRGEVFHLGTECVKTERAAGPCRVCGTPVKPAHLVEGYSVSCAEHCPVCSIPANHSWPEKAPELPAGEQTSMFGNDDRILPP